MWRALFVCCGFYGDTPAVQTQFQQIHPAQVAPGPIQPPEMDFRRTPGRARAVVLLHGFHVNFSDYKIRRPQVEQWQQAGSWLVDTLGQSADVYAFRYGQNVAVEQVAHVPALRAGVARLKKLGYREVVLMGHSAGGLVARHFVEDFPDAGVTRVVQVCAPNGGSKWACFAPLAHDTQRAFVTSLSEDARQKAAQAGKKIPPSVQFICVVGSDDWVVSTRNQWTADLREQGITAVVLPVAHETAMYGEANAKRLAELVGSDLTRWNGTEVATLAVTLTAGPQGSPAVAEQPFRLTPAELQRLRPITDPSGRPRTPLTVGAK
jgi:pimeloyl-ACP methyl ester carboxylesterase